MRRVAFSGLGIVLLGGLLVAGPVGAGSAAAAPQNAITWSYSEPANGYWRAPQDTYDGGGGPSGPVLVYIQTGAAGEAFGCTPGDELLGSEFACDEYGSDDTYITGLQCASNPGTGPRGLPIFGWIRWERQIEADGEFSRWTGVDFACDEPGEDDFVPMEDVSAAVEFELLQRVGQPAIGISPPDATTLVRLPTIVSTSYPLGIDQDAAVQLLSLEDPTRIRVDFYIDRPNGGLAGVIIADATFAWTFEGGGTAEGRGRAYVAGHTPRNNPGYYTTVQFDTTGPKTVTLNVQWTGEATVDLVGTEPILPVDIPPVTEQIQVYDLRSVLER